MLLFFNGHLCSASVLITHLRVIVWIKIIKSVIRRFSIESAPRKTDRRVIKTKKAIRSAFSHLAAEKNISDITVKDIAERADINRKTFYNYYDGVYQVIDEIENELITAFATALSEIDFTVVINNPSLLFDRLTNNISRDIDFYSHLAKREENSSLIRKIINTLKDKLKQSVSSQITVSPELLDIVADYTVGGLVAVYQSWFASRRKVPLETLSQIVSTLTFEGVNGILMNRG